jgi:hypothetical protein
MGEDDILFEAQDGKEIKKLENDANSVSPKKS